jgi:uncharacterized membrane protein YhhN
MGATGILEYLMLAGLIITLVGLAGTLAAAPLGRHFAGLFKMVASAGFIGAAIDAGAFHSVYGGLILGGLFLSWWGDLFLISTNARIFLMGVGAFFLAHVAYAGAFIALGVNPLWTLCGAAALAVPAVLMLRWLHPHLGDMRNPVYAYVAVISVMAALAAGATLAGAPWTVPAGAAMFYVSDIFVARDRFVAPSPWNQRLGLPLYYTAQLALAFSVFATQ